jgi:hypothetical protein
MSNYLRRVKPALCLAIAVAAFPANAQSRAEAEARLFPTRVLALHNVERAAAGLAPLVWDSQLGVEAARYAVTLAISNRFEHSSRASRSNTGENLWMGTRGAFALDAMMYSWTSEKRLFKAGVFPAISRSGNWHAVGHYTQMVWPATRRVGCALATSATRDYLVCRYDPAGNVHGNPLYLKLRQTSLASR